MSDAPATDETGSNQGVPTMLMRGGSSKGLFLVADDLPDDPKARDDLLLQLMGSPDGRQIDGLGGAHPLTSKVAIVSPARDAEADLDYLFLQVAVDRASVSDRQNCGNMLAAVGPFALERQLISAGHDQDEVALRIQLLNTGGIAVATVPLHNGQPRYHGDTEISGVPGSAAGIRLDFEDVAGSSAGSLLPTGKAIDVIDGVDVTLVDNGMPVVVMLATELGISGAEAPTELESNDELRKRLESIRLQAGPLMNLGDVADTTVPKLTMVSPPRAGGALSTRTFIPHRCHEAIGVLGAVSVATAAMIPDTPANRVLSPPPGKSDRSGRIVLEHPTGTFEAAVELQWDGPLPVARRSGIIRTARKLMDGVAFPGPAR